VQRAGGLIDMTLNPNLIPSRAGLAVASAAGVQHLAAAGAGF
jgi:hypothetical protein